MPSNGSFWQTIKVHVQNGHLRSAGTEILVGAIMLLVAGMVLLSANVSELDTMDALVQRSNTALLQISEVYGKTTGVEMTMRGYALTGDPSYLRGHHDDDKLLRDTVNRLADTLSGQPDEAVKLAKLRGFLTRRRQTFQRLADLGPGHAKEIAETIVDPQVRNDRYAALGILYDIRKDELKILADRQTASERNVAQTYHLALGIVALAFLLALIGLMLSRGGERRKP